jgi:UDP-N-acetyl-D-glucosamine dehydrogenase
VPPGSTALLQVELTPDEVQQADAVVLVTDHDKFDYDMVRERARYVLDTRNRITGQQVELL